MPYFARYNNRGVCRVTIVYVALISSFRGGVTLTARPSLDTKRPLLIVDVLPTLP